MRAAVAVLLAAALLAGCGDSGPTDEEQVRQVVTELGRATAAKDYQALCDRILAPSLVADVKQIGLPCEVALQQGLADVKDPKITIGRIKVTKDKATAEIRTSPRARPRRATRSRSCASRSPGGSPRWAAERPTWERYPHSAAVRRPHHRSGETSGAERVTGGDDGGRPHVKELGCESRQPWWQLVRLRCWYRRRPRRPRSAWRATPSYTGRIRGSAPVCC